MNSAITASENCIYKSRTEVVSSSWDPLGVMNKQLYLESESYFKKALNSAVECKWSLKWVQLVRVAEHFIKIENSPWWLGTTGTSLAKFPLAIFFLHLFTFLFQWNCSAVSRNRILSDSLYYRKHWFCIWSDASKHFCHCIPKPSCF